MVEPHKGTLWKKSPAGPFYQEREFQLYRGILSYTSGKGEQVKLHLSGASKLQMTNAERHEFNINGTELVSETSAKTTDRVFHFRAGDSASLALWSAAFEAHKAFAAEQHQQRQQEVAIRDAELTAAQTVSAKVKREDGFKPKEELSSTLQKKSPQFPYPWQKRQVRLQGGHSILYQSGSGGEKGISMHEVKIVRMTDPAACEFEITTVTDKRYLFRAPDRSTAALWVRELQQIHEALRVQTEAEVGHWAREADLGT